MSSKQHKTTRYRQFIAGEWVASELRTTQYSPFDGEPVSEMGLADHDLLVRAAASSEACRKQLSATSRVARSHVLRSMAEGIESRRTEFVDSLIEEAGKPWILADSEVTRARITFETAAEETKRFGGELLPMDTEWSSQKMGLAEIRWVPRGPVLGITPFNFPLNLVAHKVAPALASANPIVIKPAPQTPGCSVLLAEVFQKAVSCLPSQSTDFPLSAFQVVSCANSQIKNLLSCLEFQTVSFTGSAAIGWTLGGLAPGKRLLLELGGNAAVIVHKDADLVRAADRIVFGGFAYSGQTCISVQRVLVEKSIFSVFSKMLVEKVALIRCGSPFDKNTLVGPLINPAAKERIGSWISEALASGASRLCGQGADTPTLMSGVPVSCKLSQEEVFGPVVLIDPYDSFDEALSQVNASPFGLQAGVFTDSARLIELSSRVLEVGGLAINEVPTFRADHMPYGGVKQSGSGREGLRYAMEEFSERKIIFGYKSSVS